MERQKVHLEYPLNATSKSILWSAISTPSGLEGWFADRVENKEKEFIFYWGKSENRSAELLSQRPFSYIRFRWLDSEFEQEYVELKMNYSEITNDYVLEIIDFTFAGEEDDLQELCHAQDKETLSSP